MANRPVYRSNGGAAVDLYTTQFDENAALRLPQSLPEERVAPRPKKKPRAKAVLAPFALIGTLAAIFLLVMVVQSHVRLYEMKSEAGRLQSQVDELDEQLGRLQSEYNSKVDLRQIETEAKALGMRQPTASQTVYLSIAGADSAEVLHSEETGTLGTLWNAISDGFRSILEYFH